MPADTPPVSPRVAIVTGAGSGIGRACARALLADGWSVALVGRREAALHDALRDAGGAADAALVLPCDVADAAAVARAFDVVVDRYGRVDLLFNNAGCFPPAAAPDAVALADWQRAVDVNLHGAFHCLANAFRVMRAQQPSGGRIVNNGSLATYVPRPGSIAYSATKHAITGLTRAAALDGRALGIAVGQIDIGNVESDMTTAFAAGALQADGSVRAEPRMPMQAVVDTFMTMARQPPSANVLFATVMATSMPFVGRG